MLDSFAFTYNKISIINKLIQICNIETKKTNKYCFKKYLLQSLRNLLQWANQ